MDLPLQAGSEAIGTADPAPFPATDARGQPRSTPCDVGAYEYNPAPFPATQAAAGVTSGEAVLNGLLNPNGASTAAAFEYGLDTGYGTTATLGTFSATVDLPVSAALSGLSPNSTYHYRLDGTSSGGTGLGGDLTFTTLPAATDANLSSLLLSGGTLAPSFALGYKASTEEDWHLIDVHLVRRGSYRIKKVAIPLTHPCYICSRITVCHTPLQKAAQALRVVTLDSPMRH